MNDIKILQADSNFEENNIIPKKEYETYMHNNSKKNKIISLTLVIELILGSLFCIIFKENKIYHRVNLELKKCITNEIELKNGTYTGSTDFGYFSGEGFFKFKNGNSISGNWQDNILQGKGTFKSPNEGTYSGNFYNNKKSGKGTFIWNDGTQYVGEWKNDCMNGDGVYTTKSGVVYSGYFEKNKLKKGKCNFSNDTGKYTVNYNNFVITNANIIFKDGTSYSGKINEKTISGYGTMKFNNGDSYTGDFDNGIKSGNGIYKWKNGDSYNGSWKNDKMSGAGQFEEKKGNIAKGTFRGNNFVEGKFIVKNSIGKYSFNYSNGKATSIDIKLKSGTELSCNLVGKKLTGNASITYNNGDNYYGKIVNGSKNGKGTYTWKNGAYYDGQWKNDEMNGKGTYYYSSNNPDKKLTGNFVNGLPNGICRYYVDSEESYKTEWSNGECIKVYE